MKRSRPLIYAVPQLVGSVVILVGALTESLPLVLGGGVVVIVTIVGHLRWKRLRNAKRAP